ncbi:uncharacterized protein K02A2.6-like [Eupeodes corollae]|uniref:uncharacterized protein K02A2.6-like n=1 Tax=Eupeodes corollae TaxID=290404 RepID=UPI00248F8915|nr:uncharacterized protein K02A2.6-like [Eupeodes corollae]
MGANLNSTLRNLCYPEDVSSLSFDKIVEILSAHFMATKNKFSEAIRFRGILQNPEESISAFEERLRAGARFCEFSTFLDYSLIVQFIHGVSRDDIRDAIIAKKPEKFVDAVKIAASLEATRHASNSIKANPSSTSASSASIHQFVHDSRPRIKKSSGSRSRSQQNRDKSQSSKTPPKYKCFGCGGNHWRQDCKFKNAVCRLCKSKGHIAAVCRQSKAQKNNNTTNTNTSNGTTATTSSSDGNSINFLQDDAINKISERVPPIMVDVRINNKPLKMELDTAGASSMVSIDTFKTLLPLQKLTPSERTFCSFTKNKFKCQCTQVNVTFEGRSKVLTLYVTDFPSDNIFGREWIVHFSDLISFEKYFKQLSTISVSKISTISDNTNSIEKLLIKYEDLFSETAGTMTGPPVDVHFKTDVQPVFARARPIPYSLLNTYSSEIDKKLQSGFYKKVTHSRWASPTHVVVKGNKIRITGDYKSTLNPQLIVDEHPISKAEDIFNKVRGAKVFCRLDITDAFMSLPCSEEFSEAMTLNTPTHGLIQPTRAQYGVASIPAVWHRRTQEITHGLKNTINFFDDFLVFADTVDELLIALEATFVRLHQFGLKLRRSKCAFLMESVDFLGHRIDGAGIHKLDKHVSAIRDAPQPTTAAELQTFLGKITYYHSFIPNLSTISAPLREMIKQRKFYWTSEGRKAFEFLKKELVSDNVLISYHPNLPLLLAVDASPVGLGAVLSHRMPDGRERPIAYASKSLNSTERAYPQIDREALAIVWGVKKFFQYLYGRKFIIITDNKPVSYIFAPNALLPKFTLSRCSNYASYLTNFNYEIQLKTSNANANADYLSRAISIQESNTVEAVNLISSPDNDDFDQFVLQQIRQIPVTADDIASETRKDTELSPMLSAIQDGRSLSSLGYTGNQLNYTQSCGCLLLGHRVVIPKKFRHTLLEELHTAHIGITKMKGIARSLIYWPSIDQDIEKLAKSCSECLKHAKLPPKYNTHHWEYPSTSWERVHIDYAGPVQGKYLLIIVDSYSKWTQVKLTTSITAEATCKILEEVFSTFGVPTTIVSDNGPQFCSETFQEFLKIQGVRFHKRTAPYHPSTNGQAERYVQTVKRSLLLSGANSTNLQHCINKFLIQFHKAPHQTTGQPPSLLFLGRVIRSRLDCLRPELKLKVLGKQQPENLHEPRSFEPNQQVMFRSYSSSNSPWLPGTIVTKLGSLHYEVEYKGVRHKRHIDQLKEYTSTIRNSNPDVNLERRVSFYEDSTSPDPAPVPSTPPAVTISQQPRQIRNIQARSPTVIPRCSGRIRRGPLRYSP